jgi:hypothetical protein
MPVFKSRLPVTLKIIPVPGYLSLLATGLKNCLNCQDKKKR